MMEVDQGDLGDFGVLKVVVGDEVLQIQSLLLTYSNSSTGSSHERRSAKTIRQFFYAGGRAAMRRC